MSMAAIILTEHLTEQSNVFMTALSLTKRIKKFLGKNLSSKTVALYRHKYLSNNINMFKRVFLILIID